MSLSLIFNPLLSDGFQYVTIETNYPEVANYSALPDPTTVTGQIYYVDAGQGSLWTLNKKDPGLYRSNGSTWISADIPSYFSSGAFAIQDNITPSKQLIFNVSAISSSTTRTITMPNANVDLTNSYQAATTSVNGYLSSTNWTTFNNKIGTASNGLTLTGIDVALGGTLIGNTTIGVSTNTLSILDTTTYGGISISTAVTRVGSGFFSGNENYINFNNGVGAALFNDTTSGYVSFDIIGATNVGFKLKTKSGGFYSILRSDNLTADKTFQYPNNSGTFALISDLSSYALVGQTFYIGTTLIAINRASAALVLTGITSIDGLAASATILATARTINGTSFDGSANIIVTAAAGTLTGTTLNATVITSSLTSVGTIGTGVWNGSLITGTYGGTGINNGVKTFTYLKNISFTAADDTGVYTLPTGTKTLVDTTVATLSSLSSIGTITTGVWNAGAVTSSGQITGTAFITTGTAGAGFINLIQQSSTPATPSSGISLYHSTNGISWVNTGGFTRSLTMPSSNVVYTFPSATDTLAGLGTAQTWTAANTYNVAPKFASGIGLQDANGVNLISFPSTVSSAINYFTINNSATGVAPILSVVDETTGGANAVGVNTVFASQKGRGTSQASYVEIQTPSTNSAGGSGALQSLGVRMRVGQIFGTNNDWEAIYLHSTTPTATNYNFATTGASSSGTTIVAGGILSMRVNGNQTVALNVTAGSSFTTNSTASSVYRTSNGGSDVTPHFMIDPGNTLTTAGAFGFGFGTADGLIFTHANGTRRIAGWSAKLTSLVNTAGSESSNLTLTPQNITDKFIVSGILQSNGITDGSSASAGIVGEEIISTISTYTNYTTTVTYQAITSITLTAGDWDISAIATFSSNTATITTASNAIFVISTTSASASGSTEGLNIIYLPQAALVGTSKESVAITPFKVTISATTTYYFNTQAAFTLGNPQYVGTIRARRER